MILNVYKPKDWTSFDVVAKIRNISGEKKVGHAGTLDPLAEGVLVILTGEDTKKQSLFMKQDKKYYVEMAIGVFTPSYDLEFVPELKDPVTVSYIEEKLDQILKKYTGTFKQQVPIFSAKKVKGKRLYEIARKPGNSEMIDLPYNEITIYTFEDVSVDEAEIQTKDGSHTLPIIKATVGCSSGTYIRSLVRDIGRELESEAVMTKLVRTAVGEYLLEDSIAIEDLKYKDIQTSN